MGWCFCMQCIISHCVLKTSSSMNQVPADRQGRCVREESLPTPDVNQRKIGIWAPFPIWLAQTSKRHLRLYEDNPCCGIHCWQESSMRAMLQVFAKGDSSWNVVVSGFMIRTLVWTVQSSGSHAWGTFCIPQIWKIIVAVLPSLQCRSVSGWF